MEAQGTDDGRFVDHLFLHENAQFVEEIGEIENAYKAVMREFGACERRVHIHVIRDAEDLVAYGSECVVELRGPRIRKIRKRRLEFVLSAQLFELRVTEKCCR